MRYVAHACAKEGAIEAAYHLSRLQQKCGRTKFITAGSRVFQSVVERLGVWRCEDGCANDLIPQMTIVMTICTHIT
eukprot:g21284.t1